MQKLHPVQIFSLIRDNWVYATHLKKEKTKPKNKPKQKKNQTQQKPTSRTAPKFPCVHEKVASHLFLVSSFLRVSLF